MISSVFIGVHSWLKDLFSVSLSCFPWLVRAGGNVPPGKAPVPGSPELARALGPQSAGSLGRDRSPLVQLEQLPQRHGVYSAPARRHAGNDQPEEGMGVGPRISGVRPSAAAVGGRIGAVAPNGDTVGPMIGTVSRYGVTVCPDAATVGPNIGAVERYGATVEPKIGDVGQFGMKIAEKLRVIWIFLRLK